MRYRVLATIRVLCFIGFFSAIIMTAASDGIRDFNEFQQAFVSCFVTAVCFGISFLLINHYMEDHYG